MRKKDYRRNTKAGLGSRGATQSPALKSLSIELHHSGAFCKLSKDVASCAKTPSTPVIFVHTRLLVRVGAAGRRREF